MEMKETSIEQANLKATHALRIFEEATQKYSEKARRYVYAGPITLDKPMPKPEALLNINALKDIDELWLKIKDAEGILHEAFVQLSVAQDAYFVRGEGKSTSPKFKCPKCGSTNLWQTTTKPLMLICRKCKHEFDWPT